MLLVTNSITRVIEKSYSQSKLFAQICRGSANPRCFGRLDTAWGEADPLFGIAPTSSVQLIETPYVKTDAKLLYIAFCRAIPAVSTHLLIAGKSYQIRVKNPFPGASSPERGEGEGEKEEGEVTQI